MLRFIFYLTITAIGVSSSLTNAADDSDRSAALKAAYVYYFSKFTRWENEDKKSDDLLICITGSNKELSKKFKSLENKTVGKGILNITFTNEKVDYDISNCNILYTDTNEHLDLLAKSHDINRPGLLLVSNEGDSNISSTITFVIINNKLMFIINTKDANKRRLTISSKLLKLAHKVND